MDHAAIAEQLAGIATEAGQEFSYATGGVVLSFQGPLETLPADDWRFGVVSLENSGQLHRITVAAAHFSDERLEPKKGEHFTNGVGKLWRIEHVYPREDGTGLIEFTVKNAGASA